MINNITEQNLHTSLAFKSVAFILAMSDSQRNSSYNLKNKI